MAHLKRQSAASSLLDRGPGRLHLPLAPPLKKLAPMEEEMAIHSSILTWRIPWTEEIIHRITYLNWFPFNAFSVLPK